MGKVCVCGADEIIVDYNNRTVSVGDVTVSEGDYLSIDGTSGLVYAGKVETSPSEIIQVLISKTMKPEDSRTYQNFAKLMQWCDDCTKMKVRTNADSPKQTETAIAFGATGIGLCRTEHMFFEGDRIDFVREMILSTKKSDRVAAVSKLLPYRRGTSRASSRRSRVCRAPSAFWTRPYTNSFPRRKNSSLTWPRKSACLWKSSCAACPNSMSSTRCSATAAAVSASPIRKSRKCRPAPSLKPLWKSPRKKALPWCLKSWFPWWPSRRSWTSRKPSLTRWPSRYLRKKAAKVDYLVGTMIEIPRAAVTADEIAETAPILLLRHQ